MCGIYGFFKLTETPRNLKPIVSLLALENMSRGKDSTGLAILNQNGHFSIRKTKTASEYLASAYVREHLRENLSFQTACVLGHTRMATTGAVTVTNAMPFEVENVIGIHNGIINNYKELGDKFKFNYYTTCDSESIFHLLNKVTTNKERAKLLEELDGYFSLAWVDKRSPNSIFFARTYNPLTIAKAKNFLLWSSEIDPLLKIERVFDRRLDEIKIKENTLLEIKRTGEILKQDFKTKTRTFKGFNYSENDVEWYKDRKWDSATYTWIPDTPQKEPLPDHKNLTVRPLEIKNHDYKVKSIAYMGCEHCLKSKMSKWNFRFNGFLCKNCRKLEHKGKIKDTYETLYGHLLIPQGED